MHTRLSLIAICLGVGLLVFVGCGSSQPSSGLWSCFDTGSQIGCVQSAALSTAPADVNGDGVPDHFVCADDDNDGHDRGRDHDATGALATSGHDADNDGVDDDLDCDHRNECEDLSNDANPARHQGEVEAEHDGGEVEAEHDGGEHHGGHDGTAADGGTGDNSGPGSDSSGRGHDGVEMHDDHACTAPATSP